MDKFEHHITPKKELKLKRPGSEEIDTFSFEALDFKHMPKLFKLMKKLSEAQSLSKKDSGKPMAGAEIMKAFDDEATATLNELVMEMLKQSYPDVEEAKLSKFAMCNLIELMEVLFELNQFTTK